MLRHAGRFLALLLSFSLVTSQLASAQNFAATSVAVHEQLSKRGVGHGVKLVRADGSEIKGRIVTLRDDSVDLQTKDSSALSNVNFAEVAKVKSPGLSTGAKIGIGVGIGVVVCVGIAAIVISHEINKPWNF